MAKGFVNSLGLKTPLSDGEELPIYVLSDVPVSVDITGLGFGDLPDA